MSTNPKPPANKSTPQPDGNPEGERIAKYLARAGVCSRRDAEQLITDGKVAVDGVVLITPAFKVTGGERITVEGRTVAAPERARLWRFHKPRGLVVSHKDEQGRVTVFDYLKSAGLPRVISIGRLDLNSEGLLLLTNDGGLARKLELPKTAWIRRYKVRVAGEIEPARLEDLKKGVTIDGVRYGSIDVEIDRIGGLNAWLYVSLTEGKNREIRRVLEHLNLSVNRLQRVSYGPFDIERLEPGDVVPVSGVMVDKILNDEEIVMERPEAKPRKPRAPRAEAAPVPEPVTEAPAPRAARPQKPQQTTRRADRAHGPRPATPRVAEEPKGRGQRSTTGAKPRAFGDTPRRDGAEGARPPRSREDRPADAGDKPRGARPARSFGDAPRREAPEGGRPFKPREGRPADAGDKPRGARPARSFGDAPRRDAPEGGRPFKPREGRPTDAGDKPRGAPPARSFGDAPRRGAPEGGRPFKPRESRPADAGDKPRGARPARSFGDAPRREGADAGEKPRAPRAERPAPRRSPAVEAGGKAVKPRDARGDDAAEKPRGAAKPSRPPIDPDSFGPVMDLKPWKSEDAPKRGPRSGTGGDGPKGRGNANRRRS